MEVIETPLKGLLLLKNTIIGDARGYFLECFHKKKFMELTGWEGEFVQANQSLSRKNVIRGLHFQTGSSAQGKLVRVLKGKVIDTILDVRPDSPTFGQSYSVELDDSNTYQLFVPRGFAHGFSVLSDEAAFYYKCDNYYDRTAEEAINPLDPELNIDWKIPAGDMILSDKDRQAKTWAEYKKHIGAG